MKQQYRHDTPPPGQKPRSHPSLDEFLPVMLCATGAIGVLPFAVIRFMQREWLIGAVDTLIVAGFTVLGVFVLRSRRVRFASVCITVLGVLGLMTTVYLKGAQQVYWAYPALVVAYYLLRPREAVAASAFILVSLFTILRTTIDTFTMTTLLVSLLLTAVFAYAFASLTRGQREQLMNLATRDPLTGAGNRRALSQKMSEVTHVFERTGSPASLVILDLDHFKKVNDEYGHGTGDQILIQLTNILNLRIRVTDSLYRIGGEEFVIVVEGQSIERASRLAEQLRTLVEANELIPNRGVTISLGVAELQSGESGDDWLARADEALYAAKRSGRNATRIAQEVGSAVPVAP
jgi:diguanylate cyclase (GGDEF)-like protein